MQGHLLAQAFIFLSGEVRHRKSRVCSGADSLCLNLLAPGAAGHLSVCQYHCQAFGGGEFPVD